MFASATSALQHNDFFDLGSRIRIDPRRPTVYATGQHLTERRQLVSVHRITPSHLKRQTCILRASAEEEEIEEEVADGWPLLLVGQSGLRQVAERVPDSMLGSGELIEIVADLLDILRETAGTSLAAPQIGIPLQVVVLEETEDALKALPAEERLDRKPFGPITLVNPKLIPVGRSGARHYEGCLCMPECSAMVERYTVVDVTAVSPMGDSIVMRATDWQARALQHAADHLKGTLFIDRMLSRSFTMHNKSNREELDDVPREGVCRCRHSL